MKEQHFCLTDEMTGQELVNVLKLCQINRFRYKHSTMYSDSLGGRSGLDTDEIAAVADKCCGDVSTEIIIHKYQLDCSNRIKWSPS